MTLRLLLLAVAVAVSQAGAAFAAPLARTGKGAAAAKVVSRSQPVAKLKPPKGPTNRRSPILSVLGMDRMARVPAAQVPNAKVVWVNFELARELGFDVPTNNQMTPQFNRQLLDALAYRALKPGEDAGGRRRLTMYADKYGGSGVGENRGAGRAAFLPYGNLAAKGVGLTPLAKVDPDDFAHSTGNASLYESLLEAGAGELNTNLFSRGSTRALAILDMGDSTVYPDGGRERNAVVVRAGAQLRPAHFVDTSAKTDYRGKRFSVRAFFRAAKASGELVTYTNGDGKVLPDLHRTMLQVIDRQAETTAEQVRWRVLHGAVSTSNIGLDGSEIDLATQTTQSRTAPIKVLDFEESAFGTEHVERMSELLNVYEALQHSLSPSERKLYHATDVNPARFMERRYQFHLQNQMIEAAGLKPALAERLSADKPDLANRYFKTVTELMSLANPGDVMADKKAVTEVSVVDLFGLLREYPAAHFDGLAAERQVRAQKLLDARFSGDPAAQQAMTARVERLTQRFVNDYDQLMSAAEGLSGDYYDSPSDFKRAVKSRAGFENQPIEAFVRANYRQSYTQAVDAYLNTGNVDLFREAVDKTVARSVRNVDRLFLNGSTRRLDGNGLEIEGRTIDGIHYGVQSWSTAGEKRQVQVSVPLTKQGDQRVLDLRDHPALTDEQLHGLRFRFTLDGWKSQSDVAARVVDRDGTSRVEFDIPVEPSQVAQLEGAFHTGADGNHWIKDGASNYRGYAFAVPDGKDLKRLAAGTR